VHRTVKVVRGGAKPPRGTVEVVTPEGVRVRMPVEPAPRPGTLLRSSTEATGSSSKAAQVPTVGKLFAKAGIKVTDHFLHRLTQRASRGITEKAALRAYNRGRLFYNPTTKNYIRHDSQTGISVVVDKPSGGTAITVFEGNPSLDWIPVRWRR
jgi:hypothetical protein